MEEEGEWPEQKLKERVGGFAAIEEGERLDERFFCICIRGGGRFLSIEGRVITNKEAMLVLRVYSRWEFVM